MMLNQPKVISSTGDVLMLCVILLGMFKELTAHRASFGLNNLEEWSSWSSWSVCSRSCNEGVRVRTRSCLQSTTERNSVAPQKAAQCHGKNTMYKMCKIAECPELAVHAINHQCSLHNGRIVRGHRIPFWTVAPIRNGSNPCELTCYAPMHSFSYSFGKVMDGTPCSSNTSRKVCINGRCTVPHHPPTPRVRQQFGKWDNSKNDTEHHFMAIPKTTTAPPTTSSALRTTTVPRARPSRLLTTQPNSTSETHANATHNTSRTKKKTRKHKVHQICPPCSKGGTIQQQFCESDFGSSDYTEVPLQLKPKINISSSKLRLHILGQLFSNPHQYPSLKPAVQLVLHAMVTNSERIKNEIRNELKVIRSYKNLVPIQTREYIWFLGLCPCPKMTPQREYLITGKMDKSPIRKHEVRLVVSRNSYVRRFGRRRALKLHRIQRDKVKLCARGHSSRNPA